MCCSCSGGTFESPSMAPTAAPTSTRAPSLAPSSTAMPTEPPSLAPTISNVPSPAPSTTASPTPLPTSCENTDGDHVDAFYNDCLFYDTWPASCGFFDDVDFSSAAMCCMCGGGAMPEPTNAPTVSGPPTISAVPTTSHHPLPAPTASPQPTAERDPFHYNAGCYDSEGRATDSNAGRCWAYVNQSQCGSYDDDDFSANEMCCRCGGGHCPLTCFGYVLHSYPSLMPGFPPLMLCPPHLGSAVTTGLIRARTSKLHTPAIATDVHARHPRPQRPHQLPLASRASRWCRRHSHLKSLSQAGCRALFT